MKKYLLAMAVGLILFNCPTKAQGQTTKTKLNQVELIKQFVGKFKREIGKDTVIIWDCKPFGNGYELSYTFSAKGRAYYNIKDLWGFDVNSDTWVVFSIENRENYKVFYQKFITPNEMTVDRVYILGKEEKQERYTMEVISPDKFAGYIKLDGKKQSIGEMTRIK
jgi:hypothetical protein